ncbi:MAG: molybdenum cofactor guanylyltransferase [Planctomycetota bacterium]
MPEVSPKQTDELPRAYILAGGRSRRFSSGDKARVVTNGQPQLCSLIEQLKSAGHETQVVADETDRYADLGVSSLVDECPGSGPFSALLAAIDHERSEESESASRGVLLLPCDLLRWRAEWSAQLRHREASVVCFASTDQEKSFQPMPAFYRVALEPSLRAAFDEGERSLYRWLSGFAEKQPSEVHVVHTTETPRDWSFNSEQELSALLRRLAAGGSTG